MIWYFPISCQAHWNEMNNLVQEIKVVWKVQGEMKTEHKPFQISWQSRYLTTDPRTGICLLIYNLSVHMTCNIAS